MITCLEMSTRAIGNALFEYAALFGVGQKLGLDIRMPTGDNHTHQPTGQKIWQLKEIFDINTPDITQTEIDGIQHTYTEKRKEFNPEIFTEVKDNTNLIGFFQSEDYYNFCQDGLRQQLKIKDKWIQIANKKFESLGMKWDNYLNDCVFVHVRRGDYTLPHLQPFHPLLPVEYYIQAFDIMLKKNPQSRFLVFSDDKEYCKKVFPNGSYVIDNSQHLDYDNIVDFTMMTMCKGGAVLANSSFSYWAAWIANQETIVCNKIYLGPGYNWHNPMKNLKWIKI